MWIRSCGLCREAVARVVFSTITIRALIVYKQAWFTCNFCVLLFMSKTGRFLNVRLDSMLGKLVRPGSIPSVNNSQARKFSSLSGKFSQAELLGFLLYFSKFLLFFFSVYCRICYIYIYISSTDLRHVTTFIYMSILGARCICNGQRMLNWRDLAVILKRLYRWGQLNAFSIVLFYVSAEMYGKAHVWSSVLILRILFGKRWISALKKVIALVHARVCAHENYCEKLIVY
jgi:hypothetical protein